tara:strand:+ start:12670 stop:14079 length:1410 start_codon:yes stop_codon:yes gene_type:complete
MKATLSTMYWINRSGFSPDALEDIKKELTINPKPSPMDTEPPLPIPQYIEEEYKIGVPVAYGISRWGESGFIKDLSVGEEFKVRRLPDPNNPKAPPRQAEFFRDMVDSLVTEYAVLAVAPTGSGKTVAVLNAIGTLGKTALVVVPTKVLAEQWKQEAMRHLGMEEEEIGILSGASKDRDLWDKNLVIAVIHNLFMKEWPQRFYDSFGFVAWDEAHKLGARVFASTMTLFNPLYRIAVTATEKRKDGGDSLYLDYFGKPKVVASSKALDCNCWVVPFEHIGDKHKWIEKCKSNVKPLKYLSNLSERNALITRLACRLYDEGRELLIITKFIDHAELLGELLASSGIPVEDIGYFCGNSKGKKKGGNKRPKATLDYLEGIKKDCPVILATYSMMKEGVDIPRLDAGIEALPSPDNIQAVGRVRRPLESKRKPLWFSISDKGIPLFEAYTRVRLKGFQSTNVTINYLEKNSL